MVSTTIDAGNFYITTGTISGNTITHDANKVVKIETTKIDHTLTNPVNPIPIPNSKQTTEQNKSDDKDPFARVIDLKMIKETVSVQGFLADETSESAITKRNNLLKMVKQERVLKVVWGRSPYQTLWQPEDDPKDGTGIFITQMMFTETAGIVGEGVSGNPQPERNWAIQFQCIRGKDM